MVPGSGDEPIIKHNSRIPHGYVFVPKGNVFITGKVRKLTNEAGKILWRVQNVKGQDIGLRCPVEVYEAVLDLEAATRADREENIIKRDLRENSKARAAILRLFPRIPKNDVAQVVKRAFEKATGRVGRTTLMTLDDRVTLAVWAHIRHVHTLYDSLLRRKRRTSVPTVDKEEARRQVRPVIEQVFCSWGGTDKLMKSSRLICKKNEVSQKGGYQSSKVKGTSFETRGRPTTKRNAKTTTTARRTRSARAKSTKRFL